MSKRDELALRDYLGHIQQAISRIDKYLTDIDHTTFLINEEKRDAVIQAHETYVRRARELIEKAQTTLGLCALSDPTTIAQITEIEGFIAHAVRQIEQIERRVLQDQKIPHGEKVFSLFQPYTEWLSKGKAGVPVELGLRVCVLEDQWGFILHHQVMERQTDDQVAVEMVSQTQSRFPDLKACSFHKGFHSPANQTALRERLELPVLPKKGRLNRTDKERETAEAFQGARRQHSAVESAINALEVHGLGKCPDHGIDGFKRYVSMAVLARNIQKVGAELRKREREQAARQRKRAA